MNFSSASIKDIDIICSKLQNLRVNITKINDTFNEHNLKITSENISDICKVISDLCYEDKDLFQQIKHVVENTHISSNYGSNYEFDNIINTKFINIFDNIKYTMEQIEECKQVINKHKDWYMMNKDKNEEDRNMIVEKFDNLNVSTLEEFCQSFNIIDTEYKPYYEEKFELGDFMDCAYDETLLSALNGDKESLYTVLNTFIEIVDDADIDDSESDIDDSESDIIELGVIEFDKSDEEYLDNKFVLYQEITDLTQEKFFEYFINISSELDDVLLMTEEEIIIYNDYIYPVYAEEKTTSLDKTKQVLSIIEERYYNFHNWCSNLEIHVDEIISHFTYCNILFEQLTTEHKNNFNIQEVTSKITELKNNVFDNDDLPIKWGIEAVRLSIEVKQLVENLHMYLSKNEDDLHNIQSDIVTDNESFNTTEEEWCLNEITSEQRQTGLILDELMFEGLVREIMQDYVDDMDITPDAVKAIQSSVEDYIINIYNDTNLINIRSGNPFNVIEQRDIQIARRIRNDI